MAYHFEPMLTRMRKEVAHRSNKENGATLLKPSAVTLGKAALYNNSQADSTHELESFVDNMELLYQHNIPISEWSGLLVDKLTVLTRNMIAGIPPIEKQEILSCPVNIYLLMLQCRYRQVDREYVYFTKLNLIRKEEDWYTKAEKLARILGKYSFDGMKKFASTMTTNTATIRNIENAEDRMALEEIVETMIGETGRTPQPNTTRRVEEEPLEQEPDEEGYKNCGPQV
eukprot:Nk52_evm1s869 gene=Nk52_evmTU1s869